MKILIASTEKTGNTWLKLLFAQIYDLPTPYIGPEFSPAQAASLGDRWVAHQHFLPDRALLEWAIARKVRFLTTIRHPASTLVSLYHYCRNYPENYEHEFEIADALKAEPVPISPSSINNSAIPDGALIRILQRRLMCDLNISISWMVSGLTTVVRYEDLHGDPLPTLVTVTNLISPVTRERIEEAIAHCQLDILRERQTTERNFFRRGSLTEWTAALPAAVCHRFVEEEPYKSQCVFLGYDLRQQLGEEATSLPAREEKSSRILVVPILRQLLESIGVTKQTWFPEHLLSWANASAEPDTVKGQSAVPLITNLAAFIYKLRPDLQSTFPDIFDANRIGYAIWFLRYAHYAYQLDQRFLTPVASSWLRRRPM